MTNIEILYALNGAIQDPLNWTKHEQNRTIDEAIKALEKQIPNSSQCITDYDSITCGYCPYCGQKF